MPPIPVQLPDKVRDLVVATLDEKTKANIKAQTIKAKLKLKKYKRYA